jgi:hypothetical protein
MLKHERSGFGGWILRTAAVLIAVASVGASSGTAGPATQRAGAVELKPAAIVLDIVPREETKASGVLRCRAGMKILSVESSDPGLVASWREGVAPGICVVTATFPAGYIPATGSVELVVKAGV